MISNNVSKAVFHGNGVVTQFPFNFKVWGISQLLVQIVDINNITTIAKGWTLTLSNNGGTVTYIHEGTPLPSGYKLVILRNMPFTQEVDLISGTRFDSEVIESALDRATAERQQLFEALERSIKIGTTANITADELLEQIFTAQQVSISSAQSADLSAQSSLQEAETAMEQAKLAQQEADRAQQEGQTQVNLATEQADRAQQEADRAGMSVIAGTVVAFSGQFSGVHPIPLGLTTADTTWHICNGENGTPNLRNKFILGGDGSSQGDTGGDVVTEGHTLTVEELARHGHTTTVYSNSTASGGAFPKAINNGAGARSWSVTASGGSQSHSHNQNLPPYYTLAYIMKIS